MFWRYFLLSLLLLLLSQTLLEAPLRGLFSGFLNPLQYGAYTFSQNLRREADFWAGLRDLKKENRRLLNEVLELTGKLSESKGLSRENMVLRGQLKIGQDMPAARLVFARVIGKTLSGRSFELTLSSGEDLGLSVGDTVILEKILLGKIVRVEKHRSAVRLVLDADFAAAVLDEDSPDRARGLARGQFGARLLMEKILPGEQISIGDTIITSGEDGNFPKGLVVGKISRIVGAEADVFKSAEVELLIDPRALEEVFVIK